MKRKTIYSKVFLPNKQGSEFVAILKTGWELNVKTVIENGEIKYYHEIPVCSIKEWRRK